LIIKTPEDSDVWGIPGSFVLSDYFKEFEYSED